MAKIKPAIEARQQLETQLGSGPVVNRIIVSGFAVIDIDPSNYAVAYQSPLFGDYVIDWRQVQYPSGKSRVVRSQRFETVASMLRVAQSL